MKKLLLQLIFFIFVFLPAVALADFSDGLPNILNGQTTLKAASGDEFYGGLGGNQAIFNWQRDYQFSFVIDRLNACSAATDIKGLVPCLVLGTPTAGNSVSLMSSITYRDGLPDLETVALIYPKNTIAGDIFGQNDVLPNFSKFGKHLQQSGSDNDNVLNGSSAYYKMDKYTFNPKAQAYWKTDDANKNVEMTKTIERLLVNSKSLPSIITSPFDGVCGTGAGISAADCLIEQNQYPNGRVWKSNSSININSDFKYRKLSTIIIGDGINRADLTIDGSIFDDSSGASTSAVGFIVRNGNVNISNASGSAKKINANFFVPNGNLSVAGNNIAFTGSFVAKEFEVTQPSASNINFGSDTRTSTVWPPGFREFKSLTSISN